MFVFVWVLYQFLKDIIQVKKEKVRMYKKKKNSLHVTIIWDAVLQILEKQED